jgi:hypothetical protein
MKTGNLQGETGLTSGIFYSHFLAFGARVVRAQLQGRLKTVRGLSSPG